MTNKHYYIVDNQSNVCINLVLWNGNPDVWTPPSSCIALEQENTQAKIWVYDVNSKEWNLEVQNGQGQIGFTWDGTYLVTSDPIPSNPSIANQPQPLSNGAQIL